MKIKERKKIFRGEFLIGFSIVEKLSSHLPGLSLLKFA